LNIDDRLEIQACLDRQMTFKAIGKLLGKDQTTISKEVKKHIDVRDDGLLSLDMDGRSKTREVCPELLRAPFVCNPCKKRHARCKYIKQFYHAKKAQAEYEALLSESREGIPLNKESFYEMDRIVTDGIKKGQHLYHIMNTHDLGVSKSTLYRHLKRGYLSASPLDFPRVVKFKTRSVRQGQYVPKAAKEGRTYDDFLSYIAEYNVKSWVEMDTVIGLIGGKTIMTFDFTFCNFMFGRLLEGNTAAEVTDKISRIKESLSGSDSDDVSFGEVFPLILTDNGGEFANVSAIENSIDGEKETSLFFCDPYRSSQKPYVEKTHTMFRDIVPKGTSFEDFTQKTVDLIFSHVNSVKRKSLGGKTSFEVFSFVFGADVANKLGIRLIPAQQVVQSPKLLKK